ncbi:peptidoglycan DD-metalloendopeptidase family protein [Oceanisphaera sp. W20_SRM_FM3]|uniref:peptidoglycan DD-metalloendopeptidase family protein n=1 Tax=Oceanisphaera sp. W20_SRM_FM3 TaxID=3240267 RepID=UPI003F95D13B
MGALLMTRLRSSLGTLQYLFQLVIGRLSLPKAAFIGSLIWLLLWVFLWPALAQAESYRYRDANGMTHYMDNQRFSVKPLPASGQEQALNRDGVLVRVLEQADGHFLIALNRLDTPVTLNLQFSRTHNLAIAPHLQQPVLLPAKTETLMGKLTPNQAGDWRYQYNFGYQYGAELGPLAKNHVAEIEVNTPHKSTYFPPSTTPSRQNSASNLTYRGTTQAHSYQGRVHDLASPVIGPYRIAQGFNGAFSHNKTANRYALDIALPVGTPLYASRTGVVVAAVDSHVGGGLESQYRGKANHLRVRHSDGSMTLYVHLQTGSLRVAKGDQVRMGQPIAASGNTGYSSGPHLHLALQVNNSGINESIPFTLQGNQPLAGIWITGTSWGDE